MNRWISADRELLGLFEALSGYNPHPNASSVIFEFDDGIPVAAVAYDHFNGQSVHAHIWIAKGRKPSRVWWWVIHDYVINQLFCKYAIAVVDTSNARVLRLVRKMGFTLVARIADYYPDGDALFFAIDERSARHWQKYRNGKPAPGYRPNIARMQS